MKKKILFFVGALYGGGAERIAQTILSNLNKEKYAITLYSMHQEHLDRSYPSNLNYRYIFESINSNTPLLQRLSSKIKNKIKLFIYYKFPPQLFYKLFIQGRYDVEIAFIEGYATRIISGSCNIQSKKIAWVHSDLTNNHWTKIAYQSDQEEDLCYTRFDKVVSVSESVQQATLSLFNGIKSSKVIYNPIDEEKIWSLAKKSISLQKNSYFRFLSVGRLVEQKGYDRLLPIIKRIINEKYDIELIILGNGPDKENLQQYIDIHKLGKNISLLGFQDNPYPYFLQSDAYIASSRAEGYSTVVTEALILGLPVVATNCAGMSELLGLDSKHGLLVDNNNESLYQGMMQMMNPSIHAVMKNKASTRGKDFKLTALMQQVESTIN